MLFQQGRCTDSSERKREDRGNQEEDPRRVLNNRIRHPTYLVDEAQRSLYPEAHDPSPAARNTTNQRTKTSIRIHPRISYRLSRSHVNAYGTTS